jgi:2-polyprenyl-6-hydroxyphenyl methylase/3-demethylubiquinone-9 3-methyltransferase
MPQGATIDPGEIARFDAMAASWWDAHGPMAPLHQLNPVRIGFIRDQLAALRGRDPLEPQPLAGLRIIDIGCGGGLLSEPLVRLGARVTGIDAAAENIAIARDHAAASGLAIDYQLTTAESLATSGATFDAALAMEVVEHVADPDIFLEACARLLAPEGVLFLATINRTAKAFAFAIVGAEYLLRWLPRGTHDWRRFMRPSELAARLRPHGLDLVELCGVAYDPLTGRWHRSRDLGVNYMGMAARS